MSGDQAKSQENLVDEHRRMVVMTGNISEFQIENLKKWPFLAFQESLEEVKVDYNFIRGSEDEGDLFAGKVNFDFKFKSEPENVEQALAFLSHCTKYLFWEDTEVSFTKEGKKWPKTKKKKK